MLNKQEYTEKHLDLIALRYFKENPNLTKEQFIDQLYEEYRKFELVQEAKSGDLFLDVVPALRAKEVILENIVTITRDYVTLSIKLDGINGSLRLSTEELYKYIKEH